MNDTEYNHQIWINEVQLSNDFHHVFSILSYMNSFFSMSRLDVGRRFHYASLTPCELCNKKILGLAKYLDRVIEKRRFQKWYDYCHNEILISDFSGLLSNLKKDIVLLDSEIKRCKKTNQPYSLIYRKTIPAGVPDRAKETMRRVDKYLQRDGVSTK